MRHEFLVLSSNPGGNFEIGIPERDGSSPRKVSHYGLEGLRCRDVLSSALSNDLKLLLAIRGDDDGISVRTSELGGTAVDGNASQLRFPW